MRALTLEQFKHMLPSQQRAFIKQCYRDTTPVKLGRGQRRNRRRHNGPSNLG